MVVHIFNPSTWEPEAKGSLGLRPASMMRSCLEGGRKGGKGRTEEKEREGGRERDIRISVHP
jgi:hypothetical protein